MSEPLDEPFIAELFTAGGRRGSLLVDGRRADTVHVHNIDGTLANADWIKTAGGVRLSDGNPNHGVDGKFTSGAGVAPRPVYTDIGDSQYSKSIDLVDSLGYDNGNVPYDADVLKDHVARTVATELKGNQAFEEYVKKHMRVVYDYRGGYNEHGDEYATVNDSVAAWADSSSDNNPLSQLMQHAAAQEFHVDNLATNLASNASLVRRNKLAEYEGGTAGNQAILRQMYTDTQAKLAQIGVKELLVHRGYQLAYPQDTGKLPYNHGEATVTSNALSSWSLDKSIAKNFGVDGEDGVIMSMVVPASRILSVPSTGLGCAREKEVVIIGGQPDNVEYMRINHNGKQNPSEVPDEPGHAPSIWAKHNKIGAYTGPAVAASEGNPNHDPATGEFTSADTTAGSTTLRRELIRTPREGGMRGCTIIKNPTPADIWTCILQSKHAFNETSDRFTNDARYLADRDGNIYLWPAYHGLHEDGTKYLKKYEGAKMPWAIGGYVNADTAEHGAKLRLQVAYDKESDVHRRMRLLVALADRMQDRREVYVGKHGVVAASNANHDPHTGEFTHGDTDLDDLLTATKDMHEVVHREHSKFTLHTAGTWGPATDVDVWQNPTRDQITRMTTGGPVRTLTDDDNVYMFAGDKVIHDDVRGPLRHYIDYHGDLLAGYYDRAGTSSGLKYYSITEHQDSAHSNARALIGQREWASAGALSEGNPNHDEHGRFTTDNNEWKTDEYEADQVAKIDSNLGGVKQHQKFTINVDENDEVGADANEVHIIANPTKDEIRGICNLSARHGINGIMSGDEVAARYLIDRQGNMLVWPAYEAIHGQVSSAVDDDDSEAELSGMIYKDKDDKLTIVPYPVSLAVTRSKKYQDILARFSDRKRYEKYIVASESEPRDTHGRWTIESDGFFDRVSGVRNPSKSEVQGLANIDRRKGGVGEARYFIDKANDLYAWPAYDGIHDHVARSLGVESASTGHIASVGNELVAVPYHMMYNWTPGLSKKALAKLARVSDRVAAASDVSASDGIQHNIIGTHSLLCPGCGQHSLIPNRSIRPHPYATCQCGYKAYYEPGDKVLDAERIAANALYERAALSEGNPNHDEHGEFMSGHHDVIETDRDSVMEGRRIYENPTPADLWSTLITCKHDEGDGPYDDEAQGEARYAVDNQGDLYIWPATVGMHMDAVRYLASAQGADFPEPKYLSDVDDYNVIGGYITAEYPSKGGELSIGEAYGARRGGSIYDKAMVKLQRLVDRAADSPAKFKYTGGVTASEGNPNHDTHGRFTSGVGSPAFNHWFAGSKVTTPDGRPQIVYHGSTRDITEFHTDGDADKQGWQLLDQGIGSHFAVDPRVTDVFSIGEYVRPHDYVVDSYDPEKSWYRDSQGELQYNRAIPTLIHTDTTGHEVEEPWELEKHGYTGGVRERLHDDTAQVVLTPPGGRVYPVYLSIKHPLVVTPHEREMDQSAIGRVVGGLVFAADKQLFVDAYDKTGREHGDTVWEDLHAGREVHVNKYENYKTFEDVAHNFSGMLNGHDLTLRAKAVLERLGYDGIKYTNTSNNEVKTGDDPTCWIAFHKGQIKSASGNSGGWDGSKGEINASEGEARDAHGRWTVTLTGDYGESNVDVHMVTNPSKSEIRGICQKDKRAGGDGDARWILDNRGNLHVWQSDEATHNAVVMHPVVMENRSLIDMGFVSLRDGKLVVNGYADRRVPARFAKLADSIDGPYSMSEDEPRDDHGRWTNGSQAHLEPRTIIKPVDGPFTRERIIVNPTPRDIWSTVLTLQDHEINDMGYSKDRYKDIRYLGDDAGNLYVFPGYSGIHGDMVDYLRRSEGVSVAGYDEDSRMSGGYIHADAPSDGGKLRVDKVYFGGGPEFNERVKDLVAKANALVGPREEYLRAGGVDPSSPAIVHMIPALNTRPMGVKASDGLDKHSRKSYTSASEGNPNHDAKGEFTSGAGKPPRSVIKYADSDGKIDSVPLYVNPTPTDVWTSILNVQRFQHDNYANIHDLKCESRYLVDTHGNVYLMPGQTGTHDEMADQLSKELGVKFKAGLCGGYIRADRPSEGGRLKLDVDYDKENPSHTVMKALVAKANHLALAKKRYLHGDLAASDVTSEARDDHGRWTRSIIKPLDDELENERVVVNPTSRDVWATHMTLQKTMLSKGYKIDERDSRIRYLGDDQGNLYVYPGYSGTHGDMAEYLHDKEGVKINAYADEDLMNGGYIQADAPVDGAKLHVISSYGPNKSEFNNRVIKLVAKANTHDDLREAYIHGARHSEHTEASDTSTEARDSHGKWTTGASHAATFQIPTHLNDGTPVPPATFNRLHEQLVARFGGFKPLGIRQGYWEGQAEPSDWYTVHLAHDKIAEFRDWIHDTGKALGQMAMYVDIRPPDDETGKLCESHFRVPLGSPAGAVKAISELNKAFQGYTITGNTAADNKGGTLEVSVAVPVEGVPKLRESVRKIGAVGLRVHRPSVEIMDTAASEGNPNHDSKGEFTSGSGIEPRSVIKIDDHRIYVNPTSTDIQASLRECKKQLGLQKYDWLSARYLVDPKHNMYLWDGATATHEAMIGYLAKNQGVEWPEVCKQGEIFYKPGRISVECHDRNDADHKRVIKLCRKLSGISLSDPGHAGRPGEVGGSAKSTGDNTATHPSNVTALSRGTVDHTKTYYYKQPVVDQLLGSDWTPERVAALNGTNAVDPQADASVSTTPTGVDVRVNGHGFFSYCTYTRDGTSKVCELNDLLFDNMGTGAGTKIFTQEVQALRKAGFDKIKLVAARGDGLVGYCVWPKFGFDAKLPNGETIQGLYSTAAGRKRWESDGDTTPMEFDLHEGSASMKVFNRYLAARQEHIAASEETAHGSAEGRPAKFVKLIHGSKQRGRTEPDLSAADREALERAWSGDLMLSGNPNHDPESGEFTSTLPNQITEDESGSEIITNPTRNQIVGSARRAAYRLSVPGEIGNSVLRYVIDENNNVHAGNANEVTHEMLDKHVKSKTIASGFLRVSNDDEGNKIVTAGGRPDTKTGLNLRHKVVIGRFADLIKKDLAY